MNILLLSGSFHGSSFTQALLRFVAESLPGHQVYFPDIELLPFYSPELAGAEKPALVTEFIERVAQCDAIVVCTPEYNHSIPAVLKNAVDWASRPAFKSPLKDKPVTFITQATTPVGGARAQAHLKLVFDSTLSRIHPCHEMMVAEVDKKFDAQLKLIDEKTIQRMQAHLADFIAFAEAAKRN